jgi:hypothetical protein
MKRTNKISPKTEEPKKVRFLEETIEQSDDEHFDDEDQGDIDSQEGGSVESLRDEDDDDMVIIAIFSEITHKFPCLGW